MPGDWLRFYLVKFFGTLHGSYWDPLDSVWFYMASIRIQLDSLGFYLDSMGIHWIRCDSTRILSKFIGFLVIHWDSTWILLGSIRFCLNPLDSVAIH